MAKHLALCALACLVLMGCVTGCGVAKKAEAGSPNIRSNPHFRGKAVGSRGSRYWCLTQKHFQVTEFVAAGRIPALRVGTGSNGPVMLFEPTPGYAEGLKISGQAQGAELINSVLLYPNDGTLHEMKILEQCAAGGAS